MVMQEPYIEHKDPLMVLDSLSDPEDGHILRPLLPDNFPKDVAATITQCWSQDPDERPTFDEIKVLNRELILKWTGLEEKSCYFYKTYLGGGVG